MKNFVSHWHRLSQLSFHRQHFLSPHSLYLCSRRYPREEGYHIFRIKSPKEQPYDFQNIFSGFDRARDRNKIRRQTYSSFCDLTFDIHLHSVILLLSLQQANLLTRAILVDKTSAQAPHNLLGHSCVLQRQPFIPFYTLLLSFKSSPTICPKPWRCSMTFPPWLGDSYARRVMATLYGSPSASSKMSTSSFPAHPCKSATSYSSPSKSIIRQSYG